MNKQPAEETVVMMRRLTDPFDIEAKIDMAAAIKLPFYVSVDEAKPTWLHAFHFGSNEKPSKTIFSCELLNEHLDKSRWDVFARGLQAIEKNILEFLNTQEIDYWYNLDIQIQTAVKVTCIFVKLEYLPIHKSQLDDNISFSYKDEKGELQNWLNQAPHFIKDMIHE